MTNVSAALKRCANEILKIAEMISGSQAVDADELVGLQEKALKYISECSDGGANSTGRLTLSDFAKALDCPIGSVKNTLKRLQDKGFIKRIAFKNGRGGWAKFEAIKKAYPRKGGSFA